MNAEKVQTIDQYISQFAPEVSARLDLLRNAISESAPQALEKISWGMATFTLHGNLVHFAAHKKHIGFYPGVSAIEAFHDKLSEYRTSKGTIQFPSDRPLPLDLVKRIVKFRVIENMQKAKDKQNG